MAEDGVPVLSGPDLRLAAKTLRAHSSLARVKSLCAETLAALKNGASKDPASAVARFSRSAAAIAVPADGSAVLSPPEWFENTRREALSRKASGDPGYLDLGIPGLSGAVAAAPGHLVILAAETGKGKTALALNIAALLGVVKGIPSVYVNTEMSAIDIGFRLYAILSGASLFRLRTGAATDEDLEKVEEMRKKFAAKNRLSITDALPWATADDVVAVLAEQRALSGARVGFIDYVQRLEDRDPSEERWESLLLAAKKFKSAAEDFRMLLFMVAQLTEQQSLAGSKGMAREADAVVTLEELEDGSGATHQLEIVKARHAMSGFKLRLSLDKTSLRFAPASGAAF